MKFFLSGEIDVEILDAWPPVRRYVEERLNGSLSGKDYGTALCTIGIIPIILRPEWQSGHKERKLFQRKQRGADYRTAIDFDQFRLGSDEVRRRLLLRNIIEAVEDLQRKAGRSFHGQALVEDILTIFHYDRAALERC